MARGAAASGDEAALAEEALRIPYQRKAFGEETGTSEEHCPQRKPPPLPRHPHHDGPRGPKGRGRPAPP